MRQLVLTLFFFSGACGLVYQVVWARMLTQVFGTTAAAVGVALAAFMSGLALGGWLLGKLADRSPNPLRLYALLELGIGLTALATHLGLAHMTPLYVALYEISGHSAATLAIARFVLAFVLIMTPTCLMGATLPVLARFFVRRLEVAGADLSTVYAINTLGAVLGAMGSGFYLIGALGIDATVYVAVAANLALGLLAGIAAGRVAPPLRRQVPRAAVTPVDPPGAGAASRVDRSFLLLLVGLGVSGLTSFAYEIYWTRSLVFVLGNSTYALTTVLTAFIAGIALGGLLARLVVDRVADRLALFGWTQLLIAVSAGVAVPLLLAVADPAAIRAFLRESAGDLGLLVSARFGIAVLVILVPATLIGATFPLVGRIGIVDLKQTGRRVGLVYASNTLGNVAGALLPGFLLLNWLGIQRGILSMAGLNALVGVAFLGLRLRDSPRLRWALPAAGVAALLVLARLPVDFQFPSERERPGDRVLYYRDGPSATTKVTLDPQAGAKVMALDGIIIGGNTFTEYKQLLLAHLPVLLLDDCSSELSVGLGSGMLAGESLLHAGVRELTVVEIEPSVVGGAAWLARESHRVLSDPRMRLVVDDIGNHLRTNPKRYRVIAADEKTALEYASNGFSYSREYYALLRQHLEPGGVVIQWVPADMPPSQYRMVLKTFSESFPEMLMGFFMPALKESSYNTILVGSELPVSLDLARMRRVMGAEPQAFAALASYGLTTPESILAQFVATGDSIRHLVRHDPDNTLVHPRYEFFSPADYGVPLKRRVDANLELVARLRRAAWPGLLAGVQGADEAAQDRLKLAAAAELAFLDGYRVSLGRGPVSGTEIFRQYDAALSLAPWDESLRARIALHYQEIAASQRGLEGRIGFLKRALGAYDKSASVYLDYSRALARLAQTQPALAAARRAVALDPTLLAARRTLADLLIDDGKPQEARPQLQALRELRDLCPGRLTGGTPGNRVCDDGDGGRA